MKATEFCPQMAGVYLSDSCTVFKHSDCSSPALIGVYLHVEARPLRCKIILRRGGG